MSDAYTGSFPPPPDDPPAGGWSPPPPPVEAYVGAFPPPADAPPPVDEQPSAEAPRGRLGTFVLDLPEPEPPAVEDEGPTLPFDALLFDFAGLLVSSPIPAVAAMAPEFGLDAAKLLDLVFGPYNTMDGDHPYHRLERNEISVAAYAEDLERRSTEAGTPVDFDRLRPRFLELDVNEVVVEYIEARRREGFRTVLVSNNTKDVALAWKQMLPLGELFDLVVDSSSLGLRKPNPAIFRHALHLLGGVEPRRAVLLDDTLGNVEAARSVGMVGVHVVRDPVVGLRQLDVLLGRGTVGR